MLSRNKKDLNDLTATPFLVCVFAAGSREKDTENGVAVTSSRSFLFRDDFSTRYQEIGDLFGPVIFLDFRTVCITNFFPIGGALLFGCSCVLAMIGAWVQKRSLMVPYLVVQMLIIVMMAIVGIPIATAMFYLGHPFFGTSACTVVFLTSILPIHFWFVVKSAYIELGETGQLSEYSRTTNFKFR